MFEKDDEPSKISLTYGSIISFMLDKAQNDSAHIFGNKDEDPNIIVTINSEESRKNDDIFLSSEFLYSQGVFNEYSFFHSFKDINAFKQNYYNSLFLVLPKGDYDTLTKLRALKRQLKNEYLVDNSMDQYQQQITDLFTKFNQEIYTNQQYAIKLLTSKDNYVNFGDCIRFMHIKSGKFLEYKQDQETLKIYICLTETPSENSIFRFVPAFNYQGVNFPKVVNNLILKIACGDNIISGVNEKFISKRENLNINQSIMKNINDEEQKENQVLTSKQKAFEVVKKLLFNAIKKVVEVKNKSFDRAKNARDSLQIIVRDNQTHETIKNDFKTYINISSIPYKNFGKKIIPDEDQSVTAGNRMFNYWKLMIFSENFFEDNEYINSLDYFCIQNNEKNLFIQAIDCKTKFENKRKSNKSQYMSQINEEDSLNNSIDNNIKNDKYKSIIGRLSNYYRKSVESTIKLNYFYDSEFGANINYDLLVDQFEENDYIEPLGLFKFEFLYNYGKYGVYEQNRQHIIDILKDQGYVRLINVFTNKVLMADLRTTPLGNIYELKLVNNNELDQKNFYKTIFVVEKVKDFEDLLINDNDNNNQEKNKFNSNNNESSKKTKNKKKLSELKIKKDDYIKIKSKKYNLYLGIRLSNDNNNRSLILTNAISDLTKFKLNFLDDIDKYELHFFEQLLWSFNNIINFFREEKDSFSGKSITLEIYSNYVKIEHILITLEKKINNFPENNKVNISQKNKFDFMKVIEHFSIVSKLVDIFLANWFHDVKNLDYFECEIILDKYFDLYEEKEELTLLRCKTIISKEIYKILKTIYDLNNSYLNVIQDRLLYFLMFIGRDDKCTKFLIYLLKNNGTLITSLCPLFNSNLNTHLRQYSSNSLYSMNSLYSNNINTNPNNINDNFINNLNRPNQPNKFTYIKHCLKRIMKSYNSIDFVKFKITFSSVILLFNVLNCLILYNQKPFLQFYDEYFKDLEILKTINNETFPNYERNSILVYFVLKDNKIFVKKKKFVIKIGSEHEQESYPNLRNHSIKNDEYEFDLEELISLNNEEDVDNNYASIILAKLVSVNLIFYSHLSLCNQEFKSYLTKIFDFYVVMNNYLNDNDIINFQNNSTADLINNKGNNQKMKSIITNDLKYSLTKLMISLYFRISFPFLGKMDLFHCLEEENMDNIFSNLNSSIIRTEKPKIIDENMLNVINNHICNLLYNICQLKESIQNHPYIVFEVLESSKYVIRSLFVFKNDRDKIDKATNLISLITLFLENFFGFSLKKDIFGRSKNLINYFNTKITDDLNTDENFYLITDNSKLIIEKYRKKLENMKKSKENITKKRLFKKILLILSSQKGGKKYFLNIQENEQRQKALFQLNQYELSRILLELSTKGNVYEDNIVQNILLLVCDIFLEYLKFTENIEMENIFNQINKFNKKRPNIGEDQSKDEYYDLLINSIIKYNTGEENEFFDYSNEIKKMFLKYQNNSIYNVNKENIFSFFKFLKLIDSVEFRNKILEILYRQNSHKKIFYENITNIVLFETQSEFEKFLNLKDIFLKLFNIVQNMNLIKRLDDNSFALIKDLEYHLDTFIKQLIDERKWRTENNSFNDVYGSSIYNNKENNKEKNDIRGLERKRSIFNEYLPDNNNANNYFISEFSEDNVFNAQQMLYNLGFVDLINQIFEYISWIIDNRDELKDELASIESILITIYKLLVIFIFMNQKHQFIIRDKLYLYIRPLKLNVKSQNILLFIGYFLLNVVSFFESFEDFNQIQHLDEVVGSINTLQNLDWQKNKRIIPFYVETLRIIISFCGYEYFNSIYPVLDIINTTLILEILNNSDTNDDIISVIKILDLITIEQDKKSNDIKNTPILPLKEIINAFLDMLNLINPDSLKKYLKLFKIFVIVTNLFYDHYDLYKNEFLLNGIYRKNLTKTLTNFCNNFNLTDELIYCSKNETNSKLKDLNEFIGFSLPKLYIILSLNGRNNSNPNSDDSLSCIINLSNELYEKIASMNRENTKEIFFLTENEEKESRKKSIFNSKSRTILKNRRKLTNQITIKDELGQETFCDIWNKIRLKINHNDGLINFQNFVKNEINNERMNYIKLMMNFFQELSLKKSNKNLEEIDQDELDEEEKYKEDEINDLIVSYFDLYIDSIKDSYAKNVINYKNEIYFFYWTNIHMMRYNKKTKKFIDPENIYAFNKVHFADNIPLNQNESNGYKKNINYFEYSLTPYNKEYFRNLNFVEMTIKQFNSKNINSSRYGYLLYIKFLNSYLDELNSDDLAHFFRFFIKQEEVENIFSFIKMILDSLEKDIIESFPSDENNKDINKEITKEIDEEIDEDIDEEIKKGKKEEKKEENKYSSNLLENDIDKYKLIIQFITKLSADNSEMEQTMKNYLRFQYNNSKSFNFIVILSNILVNFTKDISNRIYINKYYSIIIQIIDCLSKCCNGPCEKNQDCIVQETKLLDFIRNIIKTITYRQKKFSDSGLDIKPCFDRNHIEEMSEKTDEERINKDYLVDECEKVGIDRRKLSFLKYKLVCFLSILTIGRKKGDNIFELINKVIDFDVLACVLIETYKEILIEKESQAHHENLVFGEDMLQRMDKDFDYNNNIDENFIIFEIGTYTFILINIYIENLTWIMDFQLLNKISLINKELKEKKYHVKNPSIFDSVISFGRSVYRCFRALCIKCGNCLTENKHEDFFLNNSFYCAYSFFYDYTPNIEIISGDHIMKYFVKLSPICKCLTEEMKEDFQAKVDRSSPKAKIEFLFKNVDYYHYILVHAKKRLDLFQTLPLLDLFFNHYKFYRDVFMIIGALQNVLIFCSLYRTNDDYMEVTQYSPDFEYDYGFLYKHKNITITRNVFFVTTLIQCILAFLIFLTYIFISFPRLLFFEISEDEEKIYNNKDNLRDKYSNLNRNKQTENIFLSDYEKKRKNVKFYQKVLSFLYNLIRDGMLFYHLLMLGICLVALLTQNYRFLAMLLAEIIIHSHTLKNIVRSFWLPRGPLIMTFILFYLIAYYFIIFVYLYLPHQLPTKDCFKFSDCFFTLCDQAIKNSNGIINYLVEEGLYITHTLYENPRFWIDNWFAIIDIMLVLPMACAMIINSYISLREQQRNIEKDQNNICFICGLKKQDLNQLYLHELGFYEHIKLDHYLWNYIFSIFSLVKKNPRDLISADKNIMENYKKGIYSAWVPYKKCLRKNESQNEDINEKKASDDSDDK